MTSPRLHPCSPACTHTQRAARCAHSETQTHGLARADKVSHSIIIEKVPDSALIARRSSGTALEEGFVTKKNVRTLRV